MGRKNLSQVDLPKVASTPPNPDAGFVSIYAKSDEKVYSLSSGGVETDLAATGGGGTDAYVTGLATTGTVTIDCSNGEGVYQSATLTGNITLSPSNVPGSGPFIVEYRSVQHASAPKTITLPAATAMTAMTTPAAGKAFSVFLEWAAGANLRAWLSVEP